MLTVSIFLLADSLALIPSWAKIDLTKGAQMDAKTILELLETYCPSEIDLRGVTSVAEIVRLYDALAPGSLDERLVGVGATDPTIRQRLTINESAINKILAGE